MARLPSVGGDNGQWGQILNDFLSVELNSDGTLKKAGDITTAQTTATSAQTDAQNAQSTANSKYSKPSGGIPETDLDSSVQAKLNAGASGVPDATASIKGKLQLTGDLTGTAASPQITAGAITDAKIAIGANIGQSKIQNLPADLAAKYEKPGSGIPASDLTSSVQTAILQAGTAEQAANKGQAGGYASLDGGGKVPASQLPNAIMRYQGVWNAGTNSPVLTDGSGEAGDVYRVTVAGTQNLGSGSISFNVGDYIVYNPSGVWEKSDTTDSVASVAGKTGVVVLDKNDVGLSNVQNVDTTMRANHTGTQLASTISDFDSAADARITAQKGALGGVASLDGTGKIPGNQLPALAITDTFTAANQAAQLALSAQAGDLAIRTDQGKTYVHNGGTAGDMTDWTELLSVGDQTTANSKVSKSGDTMTGGLALTNAATTGIALYNTADQTTNYERLRFYWSGNAANIRMESNGTGTQQRDVVIGGVNNQLTLSEATSAFTINRNTTTSIPAILNVTAQVLAANSGQQTYLKVGGAVAQSGTAGYTGILVNTSETSTGSGTKLLADFQLGGTSKTRIDTTGSHILSSGATYTSYNTGDETTNYERGAFRWNSNTYQLGIEYAGSASGVRPLQIGVASVAGNNALTRYLQVSAATNTFIFHSGTQAGAGPVITMGSASSFLSAPSGTQSQVSITPNVNQSGTAGYTALFINANEMATGSGAKNLIDAQIGSVSKFSVDTSGNLTHAGTFNTQSSAIIGAGTAYTTTTIRGVDWSGLSVDVYSNAASAGYNYFRKARGTIGSPSPTLSGDGLGYFGFRAHNGTSFNNQDSARFNAIATQDAGSTHGGALVFATAANGALNTAGATERLRIDHTGYIRIGNSAAINAKLTFDAGTTAADGILFGSDTNLYRSAADILTTDDAIQAASYMVAYNASNNQVAIGRTASGSPGAGITFGSGQDTNIYRSNPDTLRTDDTFHVGNELWTSTHMHHRTISTTNYSMSLLSSTIGNYPSFAPFGRFLWHDMLSFNLRWGTPTFERYNGATWSSSALDTTIFALKEGNNAQIIDGTTYTAARWTWNNGNVPYSYPAWWMIGIPYSGATNPSKNILVESSVDGVNWTVRHTSTGNTSNGYPIAFPVTDNASDGYIRLTITITNGVQLRISSMKALSSRWGDQAGGQEMNYPYQWDSQGRMTMGSGPGGTAGTAVLSSGVLNIGGSSPTTAAQGIYFGTDTNLYRSATSTLKTDDAFVIGSDRLNIATSKTPASATAPGTTGDIAWDTDYMYVCVATNTWKRTALSSW